MKTVYRVFKISKTRGLGADEAYTFFPIYDDQRNEVRDLDTLEEAEGYVEHLLQTDYGPYTIVTAYTR